jgi:hypothetical protein
MATMSSHSFLLECPRANLPKVPACLGCHQAKSELEHHDAWAAVFTQPETVAAIEEYKVSRLSR